MSSLGRPPEKESVAEVPVLLCCPSETDSPPFAVKTIVFLSKTTSEARRV